MGEAQAKKSVIVITGPEDEEAAHHTHALLDSVSGRQGLWQIADQVAVDLGRRGLFGMNGLDPKVYLVVGPRAASQFGLSKVPWFTPKRYGGGNIVVGIPNTSPGSRWWTRKNNVKRAREFLISVVDHFSRRFGQEPGTVEDVAPEVLIEAVKVEGARIQHNATVDRLLRVNGKPLLPGRSVSIGEDAVVDWEPRFAAPSATFTLISSDRTETFRTRGLTGRELDALCSEPVKLEGSSLAR